MFRRLIRRRSRRSLCRIRIKLSRQRASCLHIDQGVTMAIDVVMPQMGESIAEGTVVRWIKKAGEKVERDEPLLEISTDKVDAEIPSPVAGVLTEIRVNAGETVSVNSVVAVIGQTGEAAATPAA